MDSNTFQVEPNGGAPSNAGAEPLAVGNGSASGIVVTGSEQVTCTPNACNTGVKVCGLDSEAINFELEEGYAPSAVLHQLGLDWSTLTLSADWDQQSFYSVAYELAALYLDQGNEWLPFRFSGYEGFRCGPIAYGRRDDGAIIRASSVAAEPVFVATALIAGVHPTRVDVQATLNYGSDLVNWARGLAARSLAAREAGLKHRGWQIHVREGYGTGDTLELGSRSSESYGRVYDKYRESMASQKEQNRGVGVGAFPLGSWRYEVEYKGSLAGQVWQHLRAAPDPNVAAAGLVRTWYSDRGISLPLDLAVGPSLRSVRMTPDVERQLRWLGVSVLPTVQGLINRGFARQVYEVLGLGLPVASEGVSSA